MEGIAKMNKPAVSVYPGTIANYSVRHLVPKKKLALRPMESKKLMQVQVVLEKAESLLMAEY